MSTTHQSEPRNAAFIYHLNTILTARADSLPYRRPQAQAATKRPQCLCSVAASSEGCATNGFHQEMLNRSANCSIFSRKNVRTFAMYVVGQKHKGHRVITVLSRTDIGCIEINCGVHHNEDVFVSLFTLAVLPPAVCYYCFPNFVRPVESPDLVRV